MGPIYSKNPDVVFRKIADEFILVPVRQKVVDLKSIYTLNEVGAFLWEQLDGRKDVAQVQESVLESFDADPLQVAPDIRDMLAQLEALGLIQKI
jgi:hypothetical protein